MTSPSRCAALGVVALVDVILAALPLLPPGQSKNGKRSGSLVKLRRAG